MDVSIRYTYKITNKQVNGRRRRRRKKKSRQTHNTTKLNWVKKDQCQCTPNAGHDERTKADEKKKVWKQQNFWEMFVHLYWKLLFIVAGRVGRRVPAHPQQRRDGQYEMSFALIFARKRFTYTLLWVSASSLMHEAWMHSHCVVCIGCLFSTRKEILCVTNQVSSFPIFTAKLQNVNANVAAGCSFQFCHGHVFLAMVCLNWTLTHRIRFLFADNMNYHDPWVVLSGKHHNDHTEIFLRSNRTIRWIQNLISFNCMRWQTKETFLSCERLVGVVDGATAAQSIERISVPELYMQTCAAKVNRNGNHLVPTSAPQERKNVNWLACCLFVQ